MSSHHLSRLTRWRVSPAERRAEGARGDEAIPHATFTPFVNAVGTGGGTVLLLSVHSKQPYGLQVGVVGDADVFGAWEPEDGFRLKWTEGNIWTGRVELPPGTTDLEYKLVTMHKTGFNAWEEFGNRTLKLDGAPVVTLSGNFEGPLRVNASLPAVAEATSSQTSSSASSSAPFTPSMMPPPPPPPPVPPVPPPPRGIEPGNTAFETPKPGASFVRAPDFFSAPPPPDPDPYAAFEQRVSATFAKLQSAAERTNARFTSETKRWGEGIRSRSARDDADAADDAADEDDASSSWDGSWTSWGSSPSDAGSDPDYDWNGAASAGARTSAATTTVSASAYRPAYDVVPPRPPPGAVYSPAAAEWSSNAVSETRESSAYKYDMAADVAALEAAMPPPPPPAPVVSPEALARIPAGSVRTLAATDDGERKSWIEKLGLVAAMLQSNADVDEVTLAALGAYLRWLGTCETRCGEDSGSRSLAAASLLARDAFVALESPHVRTPAARALARRVHPWLPSISAEFAGDNANELRDAALRIATSRDVSASFRAEFEAQVQVPLARNVGPAALVAAERLAASAARGEATQSQAAREDIKEFAERLARYFNRAPALDRLGAMREKGAFMNDREASAAVAELADAMEALDDTIGGDKAGETDAALRALGALAGVRERFVRAIATPLSRDAPRDAVSRRQAYRMAELSLEESARALLGRVEAIAGVESGDFADALANPNAQTSARAWSVGCAAVAHALRHLASSGWRAEACRACADDLDAFCGTNVSFETRDEALRLAAGLSRASNLAAAHDAALAAGYGDVPRLLADALGVEDACGETFVDVALDEGVASRVARLAAPMLRAARARADASAGGLTARKEDDACVAPGSAVGIMVEIERLEPGATRGAAPPGTPLVVFARRCSGAEDVASAGRDVRGVVSAEPVRRDARLAIRAAQDTVPVTAASSAEGARNAKNAARALVGEWVSLAVGADDGGGVALGPASASEIERALVEHANRVSVWETKKRALRDDAFSSTTVSVPTLAGPFRAVAARDCLTPRARDLLEATAERAGYKAASLGDVARVASRPASGFRALRGVTLPFGCFEACVREQGKQTELDRALDDIDAAVDAADADALRAACDAARRVALATLPSPDLAATVCASFVGEDIMGPDTYAESPNAGTLRSTTEVPLLAVRASHDVEDPACAGGDRAAAYVDAFFAKHFYASLDSDENEKVTFPALGGGFGVTAARSRDVAEAVSAAWASAFTPEAVIRRRVAGVAGGQKRARVAVVVQPLAAGALSFEVRTGLAGATGSDGETHTSISFGPGFGGWSRDARAGEPWVVRVDTRDGAATTTAFASLNAKRVVEGNVVVTEPVSYAREALFFGGVGTEARERRESLARRLAAVGAVLEAEFGTPQLVEGCLVEDEVFVTRTRPRQP